MIKQAAILQDGKIYTVQRPGRHVDVIKKMGLAFKGTAATEQGFVAGDGRFVDRIQAGKIAIDCGQIKKLECPPKLYSEDLW